MLLFATGVKAATVLQPTPTLTPGIIDIIVVEITEIKASNKVLAPNINQEIIKACYSVSYDYQYSKTILSKDTMYFKQAAVTKIIGKFHVKDKKKFRELLKKYGLKEIE